MIIKSIGKIMFFKKNIIFPDKSLELLSGRDWLRFDYLAGFFARKSRVTSAVSSARFSINICPPPSTT